MLMLKNTRSICIFHYDERETFMTTDGAEVKRRLLFLMKDVNLVNEYIRRFGFTINVKHINEVKNSHIETKTKQQGPTSEKDPIFEVKVGCPVCGKNGIPCYELRAKSQQIVQNHFLVPIYTGANGYATENYSMSSVTVCPECLFASPDKKDFNRSSVSGSGEIRAQFSSSILFSLKDKTEERRSLLKPVVNFESYFKRPRSAKVATDSYRLAMARAQVEAWHELPYSYFKLGSYALKIAKIRKDDFQDDTDSLIEALGFFQEAFRTSDCPSEDLELQVIYLIVALMIRLDDLTQANSYLSVFSNLKNERIAEMKQDPRLKTDLIDKWHEKAKYLWEERENPNLFD